ncbi:response regulator [Tissierella sp.]|uniref:response regulator n=1 Tax=Tissierella sp. TaxID=41274 RepID=UPI00285625B9|nr:response regulator [Tissierella sp.]MDR7856702.1 ATP-binding protein [Tissierella sp.]
MIKIKSEEQLKNAYILLEQIFENAADGMCIIDNCSNIIEVNKRLLNLFGVAKGELLNQKCYKFFTYPICNSMDCPMAKIKSGEDYYTYEVQYKLKEQVIYFLITATPLLNADRGIEGVILSFKDITTMMEYQKELDRAKNKAEELSMLKTKFLAKKSHEIRTPMNGIICLIELLEDTETDSKQNEYIDMLKFSADRLLSIINDVLDMSKIEAGKIQQMNNRFNLSKYLSDIDKYFKLQANKKGLEFYYRINQVFPDNIIGDLDRLNQILFNIIGNAIKFTEEGSVSLEVDKNYEDAETVEFRFAIIDTGIGIPNEKIDWIFESFNQLDSSDANTYGGTGLGLRISKKLLELMGGNIEVKSQEGEGSIFSFNLKFLKGESEDANAKSPDLDRYYKDKIYYPLNILIVEDDLINQKIIKTILEKNNWNVNLASNGKKALECLENNSIDIILMDICMPEINGFEVTRIIREREKIRGGHIPIIALTASAMKEDKERGLEIGMDGYISKPIRSNVVYQTIIDVMASQGKTEDINIRQLLDRIDGDKDMLKEIIEDVVSDDYKKEHLGNIDVFIEKEDWKELSKQIHKLKGSISNFGGCNIVSVLEKMKDNIKNKDIYVIKELFKELKSEFNIAMYKLKEINNSEF